MTVQIAQPAQPHALAARRDLGSRLRVLRLRANMTGKALADLLGCHPAKISRIELGGATPSIGDIRAWCVHCSAEDQADDLVAAAVAAESAYTTWRSEQRGGLLRLQEAMDELYAKTNRFRAYESRVIPGLLQGEDYTAAILGKLQARRGSPDDAREAAAARYRQRRVLQGDSTFAFVIEEAVLRSRIAPAEVMRAQLAQLVEDSRLPQVSIGIIPLDAQRSQWPVESFYAYDDSLVRVQLVSGRWAVTAPGDVAEYLTVFQDLSALAVVGDEARDIIRRASGE